jgi:phage terminase small subunit
MPHLKSEKMELFPQARARGLSLTASAREAGYSPNTCHVRGSELNRNPEVLERIAELREKMDRATVNSVVADRNWVLRNLVEIAHEAREARDRPGATKALELVGKELGMFVNRTQEIRSPMSDLSAQQLQAIIRYCEEREGESARGPGSPGQKPPLLGFSP